MNTCGIPFPRTTSRHTSGRFNFGVVSTGTHRKKRSKPHYDLPIIYATRAKRLLQRDRERYETDRKHHLGKNEWHETTLAYRRKEDSEHDDHGQYSVFVTNTSSVYLTKYGYRWVIESSYKSINRFMAVTTSKNFGLRFFYFAFACLLYSIW